MFYKILSLVLVLYPTSLYALDKPNILVIFGDNIGWANISAYNMGMMGYKTPSIDRIGKEGMMNIISILLMLFINVLSITLKTNVL
jgi:arylsulfatase